MDHRKLIKAGFRIFRKDKHYKVIKELTTIPSDGTKGVGHGWKIYGTYSTIKAMDEAWNDLMQDDKNIEG